MMSSELLQKDVIYKPLKIIYNISTYLSWELKGRPLGVSSPHLFKRKLIRNLQKITNTSTFIETGTYKGEMVEALRNNFKALYTIEIDQTLFSDAKKRLEKYKNIKVLNGDSAEVLGEILKSQNENIIFWLDAHYSGGVTSMSNVHTPIEKELETIFRYEKDKNKKCYLLIDDARCFTGENDYPTIERLKEISNQNNKELTQVGDVIKII